MRERVRKFRQRAADRMMQNYNGLKAPLRVPPGTLVLVKNNRIEVEHNRKPKPRWLGPYIVIQQRGTSYKGSYILAELNGAVMIQRYAAARVRLYYARATLRYNVQQIIKNTPTAIWERVTGTQNVDNESPDEDEFEAEDPAEDSADEQL